MPDQRGLFAQYLELQISATELAHRVGDGWRYWRVGESYLLEPGDVTVEPIVVRLEHVQSAVDRVLRGDITADDLQDWANLLLLFDGYELEVGAGNDRAETLRQALHALASPTLYGSPNVDRLLDLRSAIERLK